MQGCCDFGFKAAEMQINGKVFRDECDTASSTSVWQVHIPLPNSGYVLVFRDPRAQPDALLVDGFIEVVHRVMPRLVPANQVGTLRFDTPQDYETSIQARGAIAGKD